MRLHIEKKDLNTTLILTDYPKQTIINFSNRDDLKKFIHCLEIVAESRIDFETIVNINADLKLGE